MLSQWGFGDFQSRFSRNWLEQPPLNVYIIHFSTSSFQWHDPSLPEKSGVLKISPGRYSFWLPLGPIPILGRVQIPDRTKAFRSLPFIAFLVISIPSYVCIAVCTDYHGALSPERCFVTSSRFSDILENVSMNGRPTGHGHTLQTLISLERDDQFTSGLLCSMSPSNQF